MNVILWILQFILAAHTLMGAIWKFSNSEQTFDSLKILPHSVWIMLSIIEFLCVIALLLPAFKKSFGKLVPIAALTIAAEMLLYIVIDASSGKAQIQHIFYWLVVAIVCSLIAYGRLAIRPINSVNP